MAYSTSRITVEAMLPHMDALRRKEATRWKLSTPSAQTFARKIREALSIVRRFPEDYQDLPDLAAVADYFKIEVVDRWTVQAVPKERFVANADALPQAELIEGNESRGGGGQTFGKPVARVGFTTAEQVVDAWLKHLPSPDPINFPQTVLSLAELLKLYHWSRARTPRLMFFVPEGSLTLAVAEDGVEEHSWHPPQEPQQETFNV